MSDHGTDRQFLEHALDLARQGIGLTSPNPCVGAVLVSKDGTIVGSGSHTYEGVKHAEVLAIEQAGENARGATLYINLEPCCHQGRTAACVDAIIAARITRVVTSMQDPNPRVSGQGLERLQAAGIEVTAGILQQEARGLNESFAKYIRRHSPLITLKAAMTLDGKIAPPSGESHNPTALGVSAAHTGWISSEVARAHVQELRHQHDAILVGVGTIIADDPLLTDRTARARRRPLLRVILDSHLRLPVESRVVKTAQNDVLVFCCFAEDKKRQELLKRGVRVEQIPRSSQDGHPDLEAVARQLGKMEITSLMIEGGAMVNGAALDSRIVDKVFLYYAPKILAGTGSVPFAVGEGFARLSDAAYVKSIRLHRFGEDFAVEGYLKDPYDDAGD
ncbi:MAG TPA: bifunctional diaminohydroxyphosphoribosylaminopyrimidine deaminase/5-amino-6-(5-phosphoribosylamino)uracil reductase RibD [Terriglobales bacterium]|nr:bifunctional diaminohydroxyphosphoribosylaminopyrimidine deaminase/5-amino-6-(5-phosphoribosylamino)uracil reductase RibD [Terriglobales bacterium]